MKVKQNFQNERQKRLIEVYNHLRKHFAVHTKTGFAEALHYGRTSMSAALNGKAEYLTDALMKNICDVYPGVFNLDYLLNGEGELLASNQYEPTRHEVSEEIRQPIPGWADNFFEIMTEQVKQNEALHRELRQSIADLNALKIDLQHIINNIR